MYIITRMVYPASKAKEVANRFLEVMQKFPPDESLGNRVVPLATRRTRKGVETISVFEVKEGRLEQALNRTSQLYQMFSDIDGFEKSIDVYGAAEQVLMDSEIETMKEFFDKRASLYDEHREKNVDHYPELYMAFGEILPRTESALEVLDLGAGTGLELEWLFNKIPNARVTCVDISTNMLGELRRKYLKFKDQITVIESSYLDYQFDRNRYDCIISIMSFHHLLPEDKILLYRRIYDSLKADGAFIEGDFVVYTKDEEEQYINDARKLEAEKGITSFHDYHIDLPLTREGQRSAYESAGFTRIKTAFDQDNALLCECRK